jgi:DNA-binding MarR family transcriptional regulator
VPVTPIRLERFLPYRLSILSNAVSTAIAGAYRRRFSLSIPEWRVLAVLSRYPGLAAREVAERTRMDAVAVSRAVGRLLRDGRLRRSRAPADRRRSVLEVSPKGAAVYHRIAPLALRYEQALVEVLSPTERVVLDRVLSRLTARAGELGMESASRPLRRSGAVAQRIRGRRGQ